MYKLVIADDDGKTTVVPLVRDEVTIGRKEGNTIRLTERNVSRRHARLTKVNGHFAVEDLGSYNGVKVNGRKIDALVGLTAGDQITIGDYSLAVQVEGVEAISEAETSAREITAEIVADVPTAMVESPAEQLPPPRLVMLSPPAPGAEFALSRDRLRIGRAEDLDVWINHRSISREHAEVARDERGNIRITDLNSANGMRVNGVDASSAPLNPGDTLELGQVRFRFVGEGESYTFEHDQTVRAEAMPAESQSTAPFFVAAGIVGFAVIVAVGLAMWNGKETTVHTVGPVVTTPTTASEFDEALTACRQALHDGAYAEALEHGRSALRLREGDSEARSCKSEAEARVAEASRFERGVTALNAHNTEEAYYVFAELPPDSPFLARPEINRAHVAFAEMHVSRAERALAANHRAEARQSANSALTVERITPDLQRRARLVLERTRLSGDVVAVNDAHVPVAPDRPDASVRTPDRPDRPDRPDHRAERDASVRPDRHRDAAVAANPPEREGNPLLTCASTNDYSVCVINALSSGRHRNATELRALIIAYQQKDRTREMRSAMQQFIRQYPTNTYAEGFRQVLSNSGGM